MTEPYTPRPKMRRPKRKGEGDEIFGMLTRERPTLDLGKDKGFKCKECRKWHPWGKLRTSYERQTGDVFRVWWCPECDGMLRQDNMTDMGIVQEIGPEQNIADTRLLVCGSRNWRDVRAIAKVLKQFDSHLTVVIHGASKGADLIARDVAKGLGMRTHGYPAKWQEHDPVWCPGPWCVGRDYCVGAGSRRNQQMLDEGRPGRVLAFSDELNMESGKGGTRDMIVRARAASLPVKVYRHREEA